MSSLDKVSKEEDKFKDSTPHSIYVYDCSNDYSFGDVRGYKDCGDIMDKCPCDKCPCIAICKHQFFVDMKSKCSLAVKYLFDSTVEDNHVFARRKLDFNKRIEVMYDIMNPTLWGVDNISGMQTFRYKNKGKKNDTRHFYYSGPAE